MGDGGVNTILIFTHLVITKKTYKWELDSFKYKETNSDTIYSPESIFIPSVTLTVHQRLKEERLKQLIKQDLLWDKNNLNKYDEFTDDINYWEGTENYQYGDITLEYTTKTDSQPNITLCDCINDKFSMSNIEIKYCEDIFMSTYGVRNPFFHHNHLYGNITDNLTEI